MKQEQAPITKYIVKLLIVKRISIKYENIFTRSKLKCIVENNKIKRQDNNRRWAQEETRETENADNFIYTLDVQSFYHKPVF